MNELNVLPAQTYCVYVCPGVVYCPRTISMNTILEYSSFLIIISPNFQSFTTYEITGYM